ncbi:MAG: hypothetical protein DI543_07955, partial [Bradyrhizobium icense]
MRYIVIERGGWQASRNGNDTVESAGWPSSHCEALKEFVTRGMSYRAAADALNARFGTAYSRDAALGRARRMGLGELARPEPQPILPEHQILQAARALRGDDHGHVAQHLLAHRHGA